MIAQPLLSLAFLTLALAVYFALAGVFELVQALRLRPLGGWAWIAGGGLLSLALAAMIWKQWPFSGDWVVGVYVGVKVMVLGASMLVLGRGAQTARA
jgi:uncharacterized membrane protein HdeD (DUF308 family)